MTLVVGGYKLTRDQVLAWCAPRDINPPKYNVAVRVNRYLRAQGITRTYLLPCDYQGKPIFLVVTNSKDDPKATTDKFESFHESEAARRIKSELEVEEVEFVTVANPYAY
jgi:hypothetical protein